MHHSIIENGETGLTTVVAFFPDEDEPLVTATVDHPHYTSIVRGLEAGDQTVYSLFDVATGISRKLEEASNNIGSRYSIKNGVFYKDLDPFDGELADQILRFVDEDVDDWQPLVKFLDRVDANPSAESRKQLCKWIAAGKLTVTQDGFIVGYKAVNVDSNGTHVSTHPGPGVVDGKEMNGYIPNKPGSVVEMSRSKVDSNNRNECSVGLHVGTFDYAKWYKGNNANRAILEVNFDPADAVSVPTDHNHSKVRVCRYKVIGLINSPYTGPVRPLQDYTNVGQAQSDPEYYDDKDSPDNF